MTRKLVALLTAATISMAAAAPSFAQAMGMEFNMLTGAVYNALKSRGLPTDGMDGLTLNQVGQIRAILDDDSLSETNQTQRIQAILANQ
jgi:hypothetical protein